MEIEEKERVLKKILSYVLLDNSSFQMHVVLNSEMCEVGRRKYSPIDPWKETANIACANNTNRGVRGSKEVGMILNTM